MSLHGKISKVKKKNKKTKHPNNAEGKIRTVLGCLRAVIKAIWIKRDILPQIYVLGVGGGGEAQSETQQKKSVIPMYSTRPSEEMALIQVPNYCNVVQSTSIGVSISSQD